MDATTRSEAGATLEFNARPEHLAEVRKLVERLATGVGLRREQINDFLTAVDEATANAIRHGSPQGASSLVRVSASSTNDSVTFEVQDQGKGFIVQPAPAMPEPDALGGRGLPLMCALADSVEVASTDHGTRVTLRKHRSSAS